jgi:hypothetical protein
LPIPAYHRDKESARKYLMMVATRIATLAAVFIAFACTVPERVPPREPAQTGAAEQITQMPAEPAGPSASGASPTVAAPSPPARAATVPPAPQPATQPSATLPAAPSIANAEAPSAKAPPKAPPAAAAPAPTAKKEQPPPAAKKPETPPLDLASLETRLKETKAIGVMTKLSLKNQVDDLLDQFRAYYQGKLKTTLAELRKSFDLLFLKVLSLLQDGDPPLASAIVASREAIWGILSDPVKFAKFASI